MFGDEVIDMGQDGLVKDIRSRLELKQVVEKKAKGKK
jgi:hypothetical protein